MIKADPLIFSAVRFTDLVSDSLPIPAMNRWYFQSSANADFGGTLLLVQSSPQYESLVQLFPYGWRWGIRGSVTAGRLMVMGRTCRLV